MSIKHNDLKIVTQVVALLETEYKKAYTHSGLAGDFYINERKLRNIFKTITGKTINDYLTNVRIGKAKDYLLNTDDPIKKIAYNVGLEIRTLEKHFKKSTGKTPLEWRRDEMIATYDSKLTAVKRK